MVKLFHLLVVLIFSAVLLSCEKNDDTLIDSIGSTPFIVSASITPQTIDTDTINVGAERKPEDVLQITVKTYATVTNADGMSLIKEVSARIFEETSIVPLSSAVLLDNGNDVDSTKDDGIFSGWNTFEITRSRIGTLTVEVTSKDIKGFQSSTYILPLQIVRNNEPPVLTNVQAPDTIRLSSQSPNFLITVQASDPEGLGDVRQVIFNTFLPSGQPSSGNPFRMYDDGTNGDATSNNGIFSLRVSSPTNPGNYRFEFQAFDRSNKTSDILIHTIYVVP